MSDNLIKVQLGSKEIILIGTAHISKESIEEVRSVITREKPAMVCVEIDSSRYDSMMKKDNWEKLDIIKTFRTGKGFFLIANLVLSSFQRRLGAELGVKPGEEMKAAVETAEQFGIPFTFCDRDIQITLRRAWSKCGFFSKGKLLASLLSSVFSTEKLDESQIEELKKNSELDGMMSELAEFLPEVKAVLIDERDRYLAAKIWDSASKTDAGSKTAAVVGAGHLQGLKAHIEKIASGEETNSVAEIDIVPPKKVSSKVIGALIPLLIVALIVFGFFHSGLTTSLSMLIHWVLWNGSLAALGTIIALGHPLTVLTAFVGAPISTLNPFIAVGIFTGIVEAMLRRPRVCDAETIQDSITSIKGIYKNRITHALLIFFTSSIGAAIGNFISIPNIAGILFK
ncbi:MAG: TraB/GumN family protein [Spirochaetaceae bacterium]|jgi:pheromone shutdown-related protein TraB|nr:TraB/GumN family protein [Spirochaetaceae bacterium]